MSSEPILPLLLPLLPVILIALGAILVAIVRMPVHPLASIIAILAFLVELLSMGLVLAFQLWLRHASETDVDNERIQAVAAGFPWIHNGLHVLFLLLITTAVFIGRSGRSSD